MRFAERWRDRRGGLQRGATTLEYIMILSLFSVPLSIFVGKTLQKILRDLITTIVERFTTG